MKILSLSSQNHIKISFQLDYENHNSNINIHRNSQNPSIITTRYHVYDALVAIIERIKQATQKIKLKMADLKNLATKLREWRREKN